MCAQWLISDVPSDMLRIRYLMAHWQQHRDVKTCTEVFFTHSLSEDAPFSIEMSVRKAAF